MRKIFLIIFGCVILFACYWFFLGPYHDNKIKCAQDYAYTKTSYHPFSGCWYWDEHISKMTNVFDCSYRKDFDVLNPAEIREQIDMFYKMSKIYEDDVKKAYGLDDAYTFLREGAIARAGDIIASNIIGFFVGGHVSEGRAGIRTIRPVYAFICSKQFQSAYYAVTGNQAHYPKDPDSPYEVLSQIEKTKVELEKTHGWEPSSEFKKTKQYTHEEFKAIKEKYGY